ncbi:hypothetical protein ACHWQZ_G002724 [Mnemiopsis leidyi]
MENLTSRFDTSSWYYGWTLQKARARDGFRDYIVRAQDNVHVANLSVKKWFMGLRDVVQKLYLYIEQSWFVKLACSMILMKLRLFNMVGVRQKRFSEV